MQNLINIWASELKALVNSTPVLAFTFFSVFYILLKFIIRTKTIHQFQMHNSITTRVNTRVLSPPRWRDRVLLAPQKFPPPRRALPPPYSTLLPRRNGCPDFQHHRLVFAWFWTLRKWTHTECILSCLAPLAQHRVCKSHPGCLLQKFVGFHCSVVPHCMSTQQLIYPFYWW